MKSYLSSLLLSVGLFLLLVSCNSGTVRKISSFDELPDPTADTLSDWSGVPQGLHASLFSDARSLRMELPRHLPSWKDGEANGYLPNCCSGPPPVQTA